MKLTYEMKTVFKKYLNQYPSEMTDDTESTHVAINFNEAIDQQSFYNSFISLKRSDYSLQGKNLLIERKNISNFEAIINHHYEVLEMAEYHLKYERVLNKILGPVKKINQVKPNADIWVEFESIKEERKKAFHHTLLIANSDFNLMNNGLTIYSTGLADFKKAIDASYTRIVEETFKNELLKKLPLQRSGSMKIF